MFFFFMFRDVPECSGMFRNVPCSGFYRRPLQICGYCMGEVLNKLSTFLDLFARRNKNITYNDY